MEWPIPLRGPVDPRTTAPFYFLLVQDICVFICAIFWSIAYILYIKQSFRDQSYGMPILSLCANISWESIFGIACAESFALSPVLLLPWFIIDSGLVYTILKFGPNQFKNSPMIAKNLGLILLALVAWMTALQIAIIKKIGVREASFFCAYSLQSIVDCSAVAQLISRNDTSGHSLAIWFCRTVGSFITVPFFVWGYAHYPEAYSIAVEPLSLVLFATHILIGLLVYPYVYVSIEVQKKGGTPEEAMAKAR